MDSLSRLIKIKSAQTPILKQAEAALVVEKANMAIEQIIGQEATKFARAMYVKNYTLTFACLTSVIAQEIKLNEAKIIDFVNKQVNARVVNRVRYLT